MKITYLYLIFFLCNNINLKSRISELKYSYTKPLDHSNSGKFNLTVKLSNNNNDLTEQIYKIGINLEVESNYLQIGIL